MDEVTICWVGTCTTPAHPAHDPCCSSKFHQKPLCCEHYRRFHFVETGCGHEEAPVVEEKARIYFDVDGVFNACSRRVPEWGWERHERVEVNGFPILYSPDFVELVNRVTALPEVGVYWLTTWCDDAPAKLAPALGLNGTDWPVVGYDHWRSSVGLPWWKHQAIVEHLDGFDGPVLWVDDDHGVDPGSEAWLAGQAQVRTLAPESVVGVTRADAEVIERFVLDACGLIRWGRKGPIPHGASAYRNAFCRCDVCRVDHRNKTAENRRTRLESGLINHGSRSGYDAGCRCERCVARRHADYPRDRASYHANKEASDG